MYGTHAWTGLVSALMHTADKISHENGVLRQPRKAVIQQTMTVVQQSTVHLLYLVDGAHVFMKRTI